jgi:hypothetical protein
VKEYTRHCSVCKQDLPYSEFPLKANNRRDSFCRGCKKDYQREYYQDNKQYYKSRAACQKEWAIEYLRQIKAATRCADCGRKYHYCVMDFDHREGETKLFNLSTARQQGRKKIEEEIAKCDVVCANCHRLRTHRRAGRFDNPQRGAANKGKKLTTKQVDQIFILHATGKYTQKQIAARYGPTRSAIGQLLRGETHKKN